jgi:hypothetical protein
VFSGDIKIHPLLNASERTALTFHHFIKWHKPHSQRALSGFVLFYRTEIGLLLTKGKPDQIHLDAITDKDLLRMAGLVELLAAYDADPSLQIMTADEEQDGQAAVLVGLDLVDDRISLSTLIDFEGKSVEGMNFDLGVWDESNTYNYSGYEDLVHPLSVDPIIPEMRAENVGWDFNHARRFVYVFNSFHDSRHVTGQSFPSEDDMVKLANQVIYGAFNKAFIKPLFSTYIDGTNGWYRVGYYQDPDQDIRPSKYTSEFAKWYGLWSRYNPDYYKVAKAVYDAVYTYNSSTHPYALNYYGYFYPASKSVNLLRFLPSLATPFYCGNDICDHDESSHVCPADCEATCSDCGVGIWNLCDEQECLGLGDCVFVPGLLVDDCVVPG